MDIKIPDLEDVEFVSDCSACYYMSKEHKDQCWKCEGSRRMLTPVGQRLLDFCKMMGIPIMNPDGWKAKDG